MRWSSSTATASTWTGSCGAPEAVGLKAAPDTDGPVAGWWDLVVPNSPTVGENDEHGHTDPSSRGEHAEAPALMLCLREEMSRTDI